MRRVRGPAAWLIRVGIVSIVALWTGALGAAAPPNAGERGGIEALPAPDPLPTQGLPPPDQPSASAGQDGDGGAAETGAETGDGTAGDTGLLTELELERAPAQAP